MHSAEFESVIPATKRPQTYTVDHVATRIGIFCIMDFNFVSNMAPFLFQVFFPDVERVEWLNRVSH
jgi:hypothetical protein